MTTHDIAPGPNETCLGVATKARAAIPILRFQPPRYQNGWSASITGSDQFFHRIEGMADFYAALGLRHEMSGGLPPEEYIWDRYIRDGASMSRKCMHDLYVVYLHAHSAEFRKLYGDAYEEMMGKCSYDAVASADDHCVECPLHPATRRG